MLKNKMYVRCPADKDNIYEPRVFICGQIIKNDEFKRTVSVKINDPFEYLVFFEDLPKGIIEIPYSSVTRCKLFIDSIVMYKGVRHKVLSCQKMEDEYFYYYLQNMKNKSTEKVCEKDIIAPFNNGKIDPTIQIRNYEFQNPAWYIGRSIVSRSMNVLENSIYGFKELAGSKIYLLPHQINTIMRCLQEQPCRYMLADEVGMGKTVEAISIYKIFTMNQSKTKSLIIVPSTIKEQWISELLFKFNIPNGEGLNQNCLEVKAIDELTSNDKYMEWDFVIVDEVHKFLFDEIKYEILHAISKNAVNLLLLSATPVQQKKEEYLNLLRLLYPHKYDNYELEKFEELINKQDKIIQKTALILDDLSDLEEEISIILEGEDDAHKSEECKELFDEIVCDLEEICEELDDSKLSGLLGKIIFEDSDLGVYYIKVIISYICSNYQIESNIIRNRRKILEKNEEDIQLMASRDLLELEYAIDCEGALYEMLTYNELSDWVIDGLERKEIDVESDIKPLISRFFSSPHAFWEEISKRKVSDTLLSNARKWKDQEDYNLKYINNIMDDPDEYSGSYSSRMVTVLNAIYDELYDQKVVLFTNFEETFELYKTALTKVFPEDEVSFFGINMSSDEIELNSFRFQTQETCRIMLCDYTGGEGRNFQCADYVVHIDLPWNASDIEQRIGRLDRLERDMSRPVVYSVVVHTKDTFEEALFSFFRDGLQIFNQSLSGMEIIMKDINDEIVSAIEEDFKYGLFDKIPHIIELANSMKEVIRKEQNFDAAGFIYRPMYAELRRLIDYYSRNENDLFATTMTNWATLAGFRGSTKQNGIITYSATSFSPKSALNSQLIPPKWNEYLGSEQNKKLIKIHESFDKKMDRKIQERTIKGTFSRKLAIENDYLHFFAPGDEIFDCIVDNAINSCKGCSSAFAVRSNLEWSGLIFTWSVSPDNAYLLDHDISIYALSPYRNYLLSEQVIVPVSISNPDELTDSEIVREYLSIVSKGFAQNSGIVHLGKRSREAKFLKNEISGRNIEWFMQKYKCESWNEIVVSARKEAYTVAVDTFKKRSNIKGAREEMERILSARMANSDYYEMTDEGIEQLKNTQRVVLDAMKMPKVNLEAVAFVMMIGAENE